jgi:hypothetical protein
MDSHGLTTKIVTVFPIGKQPDFPFLGREIHYEISASIT